MIRSVDATDRGPGYDSSSEHLADWAALTALYIERLTAVRRATPQRVQVTAADRRALLRNHPDLAAYDQQLARARADIAARTCAIRCGKMNAWPSASP